MNTESELRLIIDKAKLQLVRLPVDKDWNSKLTYQDYRNLMDTLNGDTSQQSKSKT